MRLEDITLDHIRRGQVVTVPYKGGTMSAIPVAKVDEPKPWYVVDQMLWHNYDVCQGVYRMGIDVTIFDCNGQCVPSQKPLPWSDRYFQAKHSHVYKGTIWYRNITFSNGVTIGYEWERIEHDNTDT